MINDFVQNYLLKTTIVLNDLLGRDAKHSLRRLVKLEGKGEKLETRLLVNFIRQTLYSSLISFFLVFIFVTYSSFKFKVYLRISNLYYFVK